MVWAYIAVGVRILINPLGNAMQKSLTGGRECGEESDKGNRRLEPGEVNFLTYFILGFCCVPFAWRYSWGELPAEFWGYAAGGGLLGALGNGCLVKALRGGELSILGPINSYKSIVGLLFGILILGELPSMGGILGMGLIIAGSYLVFETLEGGFSLQILKNREIRYRLAALVLNAIEAVMIKKVILFSGVEISLCVWCWFGAIFSLGWYWIPASESKKRNGIEESHGWRRNGFPKIVPKMNGRQRGILFALALSVGVNQFCTNYAFAYIPVGYALALFQLSTVVSVFLGYLFFREGKIMRKLAGALIMMGGSVWIILG